jgi:hypothetical protein
LALDIEVTGYDGQLLGAGAFTAADPDPLVAANVRPTSNDWRHLITLRPLASLQDRLAAGTIHIRFGMAVVKDDAKPISQPLSVVIPSVGSRTCIKS